MIFLTADTHFGHDGIIQYTHRPWDSTEAMDSTLINNWNSVVSKGDTVIHLGDFAWNNHRRYLDQLNGKITLIVGNHDRMPHTSLRQFSRVVGLRKSPGILCTHVKLRQIILCHFPLSSWPGSIHGAYHFHGHSHGYTPEFNNMLRCDVGVDVWNYHPVPLPILLTKMKDRIPAWKQRQDKYDETEALIRKTAISNGNLHYLYDHI